MERVKDLADPRRCKAPTPLGQCEYIASEGSDYCSVHNHSSAPDPNKRIYLLTKADHQARLTQLSEHDELKSLREEIAITRMLIEAQFNQIQNEVDWQLRSPAINQLVLTVDKLVKDAHVIEQNLGVLLNKHAVIGFGQQVCRIIVDRLEGIPNRDKIVDEIITDIAATIQGTCNSEQAKSVALLPPPS